MTAPQGRPRAAELHARLGAESFRAAYAAGLNLSGWLEREDPSDYGDGLDAFQRQLKVAGIRTAAVPEAGIAADTFESFTKSDPTRALGLEWILRQYRRASVGHVTGARSVHQSTDNLNNSALYPNALAAVARQTRQIAPAIPLAELIAITTPISSGAYQAFFIQDNVTEQRMARTPEGTEIPSSKLVGNDNLVRLRKYGRALEVSYEAMRRMRLDMLALIIARMAAQAETDKVAAVINTIVSGDGNAGTAAPVSNLTTLDPATTANNITLRGYLAYKMLFANPYTLTHVLTQDAIALNLMLLNAGSANIPAVTFGQGVGFSMFRPINPGLADGVGLGWTADAPAARLVGFDARFAVERVTEVGSEIQEVERYMRRQVEALIISEVEGYAIFDPSATRLLRTDA